MIKFFENFLLPRVVYFPFYFAKLFYISFIYPWLFLLKPKNEIRKIAIEAGEGGWNIIEYQEIYHSACEYFGNQNVIKLVVNKNYSYISQVCSVLKTEGVTHYAYSPRTGSENFLKCWYETFALFFMLSWKGVVPIAFLTDFAQRRWRGQCAVVTSIQGLVVTLISPKIVSSIFPHSRIVGPYLMAFSGKTLKEINLLASSCRHGELRPSFVGSLYSPREEKLLKIQEILSKKGIEFSITARKLGSKRIPNEDYWKSIISSGIILTTADQMDQPGSDWKWLNHFIYRYTEACVCGVLLVAPEIDGIQKYLVPGEHFVSFRNEQEAAEKIEFYMKNENERIKIAKAGKDRVESLIKTRDFWKTLDLCLGSSGIY
jgi:hypothetical protein